MNDLYKLLKEKFAHILDKGTGSPYYWHLARCAIRLGKNASAEEKLVALFHDILEDTDTTEEDLQKIGVPEAQIKSIKLCSNIYYKDLTHKAWLKLIAESGDTGAIKAKLVDLADNKSFERMTGLEKFMSDQVSTKGKKKPDDIMKNVRHFINKKSYGLGVRFLEDMEIILSDPTNHFPQLNLDSFGHFEEYEELYNYLGEDFMSYQGLQNVKNFKVSCSVEKIFDTKGQPYIAALVPAHIAQIYQNSLKVIQDSAQPLIDNQIKRDSGAHHITILNAAEYNAVKKDINKSAIVDSYVGQEFDFIFGTMGSIEKQEQKTFYALCESGYIQRLRENIGFTQKDLHMTIGFSPKDLFHKKKDDSTQICNFDIIWREMEKSFQINYTNNKSHAPMF